MCYLSILERKIGAGTIYVTMLVILLVTLAAYICHAPKEVYLLII